MLAAFFLLAAVSGCGKVDEPERIDPNYKPTEPVIKDEDYTIDVSGWAGKKNSDNGVICSFNIRLSSGEDGDNSWPNRSCSVGRFLRFAIPDVIGFQEVKADQKNFVIAEVGAKYHYTGLDRDNGQEEGPGETAFLMASRDRYTLAFSGTFWLSPTPNAVSRGWDAACNRTVTWVCLTDKFWQKDIYVFNTHFDHVGVEARKNEGPLLISKIKEITGVGDLKNSAVPIFVTGDFNATYDSEYLAPLRENFQNARNASPETESRNTFNSFKDTGGSIIDHIFFTGVTPVKYLVVTEGFGVPYLSDHYPIWFEYSK